MTGTNDFLPYASSGGAHVIDQADYAADPATADGNLAGLIRSLYINKTLRQAMAGVSALAQFMVNRTGANVLDDANESNFIATLTLAISSVVQSGSYAVAAGTASAITAAPSPAFPGYTAGQAIVVKLTAALTGATTLNVSGVGAKPVVRPDGSDPHAGDGQIGSDILFIYDTASSGQWRIIGNLPSWLAGAALKANGAGGVSIDIDGQTDKATPAQADEVLIWDVVALAFRKTSAGGIAGLTAFSVAMQAEMDFRGMMG